MIRASRDGGCDESGGNHSGGGAYRSIPTALPETSVDCHHFDRAGS